MPNIFAMADTWNAAGTAFTAIQMNVTDTASAAASKYLDFQVGGVSRVSLGKTAGGYDGSINPYLRLGSSRGAAVAFDLVNGPNGISSLPVPTFRPATVNTSLAFDLCPNGVVTDQGYGYCWMDICSTDQILNGNLATKSLHIGIGNDTIGLGGDFAFIGATRYVAAPHLPLVLGRFDGDAGTWIYALMIEPTQGFIINKTNVAFGNTTGSLSTQAKFAAGTTTVSPLRLTAGVAPTAPVDGDIWYDGTNIKIRVGSTTKTFTIA